MLFLFKQSSSHSHKHYSGSIILIFQILKYITIIYALIEAMLVIVHIFVNISMEDKTFLSSNIEFSVELIFNMPCFRNNFVRR